MIRLHSVTVCLPGSRSGWMLAAAVASMLFEGSGIQPQSREFLSGIGRSGIQEPARDAAMDHRYWLLNSDLPQGSLSLTLLSAAKSTVRLTCNHGETQEYGEYQAAVAPEDIRAVAALADSIAWRKLPRATQLAATVPTVTFGEGTIGGPNPELATFTVAEPPAELRPLLQLLEGAVGKIRQHPVRVLAGSAAPEHPEFQVGDTVSWIVELENRGTEPLLIANPCLAADAAGTGLTLTLQDSRPSTTPDDPEAGDESGEAPQASYAAVSIPPSAITILPQEIPGRAIEDAGGGNPQPGTWLELLPEEKIRWRISRTLYLKPGSYRFQCVLRCSEGAQGSLRTLPGSLMMQGSAFGIVDNKNRQ